MAKYQSAFEKRFGKQGSGASLAQRNADNAAFAAVKGTQSWRKRDQTKDAKLAKIRDNMSKATEKSSGVGSAKPYQAPIKIKMPKREWSGETSKQLFARVDREMEARDDYYDSRKFDAIKGKVTTPAEALIAKAPKGGYPKESEAERRASVDINRAEAGLRPLRKNPGIKETTAYKNAAKKYKELQNSMAKKYSDSGLLAEIRAREKVSKLAEDDRRWKLPGDELKAPGHDAHTSATIEDRERDQELARVRERARAQRAKKTDRKFDAIQDRRGYPIGREGDEFDKYDRVSAKDARQEFENGGKEMEEYDTFGAGRHGAGEGQYSPSGRSGGKGKGRGNWGHKGRPGKRGGSA